LNGLGITIEFNEQTSLEPILQLLQEQQSLQIITANERGLVLLASIDTPGETEEAVPSIVPEIVESIDPLANINLDAIEDINGTDAALIREVLAYLIEEQGLSPQGAAYLAGNLNQESNLDPATPNGGLAQLQGVRAVNMPKDLRGQLDFLLNVEIERDGGSPQLSELLRDPEGDVEEIKQALRDWERYGTAGKRFEYGEQILEAIQTPMPEADSRLAHDLIDRKSKKEIEGIDTVEVMGIRVSVEIALNVANLLQAADADGVNLSGSGFRTTQRQAELRVINGCRNVYTASASSCRVPTAIPGRSMHEKGLALDLSHNGALITSRRNPAYQWLVANAADHGLKNLPSEAWHWSTNGR